jgi:diacylglycerol kinase (ATP)
LNPRIVVVINPRCVAGVNSTLWPRAALAMRRHAVVSGELQTRGDGSDPERVAQLLRQTRPQIMVAAGGDGTVHGVVQGMMDAALPVNPALAIIPLGTGNDVGRSLGLLSFRHYGQAAVDLAVEAAIGGPERRMDLGQVRGPNRAGYIVGSFAIGMDADILATRNRLQQRLGRRRSFSGYPLYLWSCALNVVAHRHGAAARLNVEGSIEAVRAYNLLVTNTPIYAGEFRFDGENSVDDGRLDLHVFSGPLDYLRRYPAAWRRHVRYSRGEPVQPARQRRIRALTVELSRPVAAQLDGEEFNAADRYEIEVLPQALKLHVPARPTGGNPVGQELAPSLGVRLDRSVSWSNDGSL